MFFHWLTFEAFTSFLLISSRICLLIQLISDFDGLINRQNGLFAKLSLWSLSVINASFVASDSTRSSMSSLLVIILASSSILPSFFLSAFFYVLVTLAFSSWLYSLVSNF